MNNKIPEKNPKYKKISFPVIAFAKKQLIEIILITSTISENLAILMNINTYSTSNMVKKRLMQSFYLTHKNQLNLV